MNVFPEDFCIQLAKVETFVYRAPIDQPVQTSFGIMYDRPAVLVRLEDVDGVVGWGEIWCNFPSVGAEHRARVFNANVAPILLAQLWQQPSHAFVTLSQHLRILAIQCGEPGTFAQTIAGADIALWDLAGKKLGQPLWKLMAGRSAVQTYASGLNPAAPEVLAAAKYKQGYRAFKLKVGFGLERDKANLRALRDSLGADIALMVDANQAWTLDEAEKMSHQLAEFNLQWLEEPMAADASIAEWKQLAQKSAIPLAAGENMRGIAQFDAATQSDAFAVLQPDIAKWGGFSGCIPVAQNIVQHGHLFCPHWLGGGIGLMASLQIKAMVGGAGYVEVDANPNPLRDILLEKYLQPKAGVISLSDEPGIGTTPDLHSIQEFLVASFSVT